MSMIPQETRTRLTNAAKPQPIIINTWHEVNKNGGLVKLYSVKCHECGRVIDRTTHRNTIYHLQCGIKRNRVRNTRHLQEKIKKMTLREKEKALLRALEELQDYQFRYGLMINKEHINADDSLIQAMADKGWYEKLNRIADMWLKGE